MICHKFICVCHAPKKKVNHSQLYFENHSIWINREYHSTSHLSKWPWLPCIFLQIQMGHVQHHKPHWHVQQDAWQNKSRFIANWNIHEPSPAWPQSEMCHILSHHGSFSYYILYMEGILELRIVSSLSSWQHLGHWGLPQLTNGYQVYQHLLYNSEKWLILKYSKTMINTCMICIHINTTVCFLVASHGFPWLPHPHLGSLARSPQSEIEPHDWS